MKDAFDDGYPASDARRRWLRGVGATTLASAASPAQALFSRGRLSFVPAAFDAAESRALIGVWGTRADRVHVRWSSGDASLNERSATIALSERNDFAAAIELIGLSGGKTIHYAVYADNEALSDVQSFRMPPDATATGDFTFAFSGDIEERYRPFHVFDQIAKLKPDAFIMLGDTVYADIPKREFSATIAHYRRKHAAIRADRSLQSFLSRHATIATWDDHEIENDSNGSHPAIKEAEQVFREYWPCRTSSAAANGLGLYRHLKFGRNVELFMLDARRYRSQQSDADGAKKTMLGNAQKAQFTADYNASKARYRLIGSSVPFHGSSQDAWGNYAAERDELLALFRNANSNHDAKTIILSADYHFAREWPRNEKRGIYEFTAGPLAAFLTFEKDNSARSRHTRGEHFVFGDRANFGLLRYDARTRSLRFFYYDDQGKQLFSRQV
jgi:alkaline phosphatase D